MPGRRRRLLLTVVSVVTLVAALTVVRSVLPFQRLESRGSTTNTGAQRSVGERVTVFLGDFKARGHDPVHVRAVRATGVPRGIRIVDIVAFQSGPPGGLRSGDLRVTEPEVYDFQPVTKMVFYPGKVPLVYEAWRLAIVVEAVEPGQWRTTGLDISWKAGWWRGTKHYGDTVSMTVAPSAAP